MLLIKNGTIFTVTKENCFVGDILINEGKIVAIASQIEKNDAEIVDATNLFVFPGLVEAHCHLGLQGHAIRFEGNDCNEFTSSITPNMDAIDAFNPQDETILEAALGGITTVGTGPGSANVVGGRFIAVKTSGRRVEDMIIKRDVAMKCAFGENPKFSYKDKEIYSRMAIAAKFRELLMQTKEYLEKLELAKFDVSKKPAYNAKLEAMIPVIKREMPLKAHAHRADDIFTALRIAKEFNIDITLEHCTDGHLVADILAKENVKIAVGPSLTHATKYELRNKSFVTPGILAKAGCQVSIITDSPVIPQEYLPICAQLAVKSGMDKMEALKAITINPAKHLGIDDRVGSLEVGKDADIIITDGCILETSTNVLRVFINGIEVKR